MLRNVPVPLKFNVFSRKNSNFFYAPNKRICHQTFKKWTPQFSIGPPHTPTKKNGKMRRTHLFFQKSIDFHR